MKILDTGRKIISLENILSVKLKGKKIIVRYTNGQTEKIKLSTRDSAKFTYGYFTIALK